MYIPTRLRHLSSFIDIDTSVPSVTARTTRSLRSSHVPRLVVPRTLTVFASRAFYVTAPTVWNSLPDNVVNSDTLATLKSDWKLTFFAASCETFLPPSASVFLIMALYEILSLINQVTHSFINKPKIQKTLAYTGDLQPSTFWPRQDQRSSISGAPITSPMHSLYSLHWLHVYRSESNSRSPYTDIQSSPWWRTTVPGPFTSTADVPCRRPLTSVGNNRLVVPPVRLSDSHCPPSVAEHCRLPPLKSGTLYRNTSS